MLSSVASHSASSALDQTKAAALTAPMRISSRRRIGCSMCLRVSPGISGRKGWLNTTWRRAAIRWADIVAGAVIAQGQPWGAFSALEDQVADHRDELGVHAHCGRPHHSDAERLAEMASFGVQVIDHLHVVGEKPDRTDYYF